MRNNNIPGTRESFTKGHKYVIILNSKKDGVFNAVNYVGMGTFRIETIRQPERNVIISHIGNLLEWGVCVTRSFIQDLHTVVWAKAVYDFVCDVIVNKIIF